MFRQVGVPVLGIIENMSYLIGINGESMPIFGSGGGQQLAAELNTPLLGQIPLAPDVCVGGDIGKPIAVADPNSPVSQVFLQIAGAIANTFHPVTTV